MTRKLRPLEVLAIIGLVAVPALAQVTIELEFVVGGLARPVGAVAAGDGSGRLFVVQQSGEILIWKDGVLAATPFLDLSSIVACCGGPENGLLGLAFHPSYATNGLFYVAYTIPGTESQLAEYQVSAGDPDVADPASGRVLLALAQPFGNHNGGSLGFGPDGFLYHGIGDGGSQGDPDNRGQDLSTLLGKLLRIDIDSADQGLEYAIPPSNPFVGDPAARDEIWAYGLRNPWRLSFDRETGDLWLGDVGQDELEEVDFQPAGSAGGENYGWRLMEGSACFDPPIDCNDGSLTLPVLEYDHEEGKCSVTGGFRYRGTLQPRLRGIYFYADFCTGKIWGTEPRCDGVWSSRLLLDSEFKPSSFGEGEDGEIYVVHRAESAGALYRVVLAAGSGGPDLEPDPTSLDFGNVLAGEAAELVLQVTNTNPGPEAVTVEALAASDPGRFSLDPGGGPSPCGTPTPCLAPGSGCTMTVTFSSAETGFYSETLSLAGNFDPQTVPLEAVAFVPCPHPDEVTLQGQTISDPQSAAACFDIVVGPALEVTAEGELDLVAGRKIELGNGTTISGRLTATLDPLLAVE